MPESASGAPSQQAFDRDQLKNALDSLAVLICQLRSQNSIFGQRSKFHVNKIHTMTPEEEQFNAKELVDYYRICFAHPAVDGILMWGFWAGANWIPSIIPLQERLRSPTPALEAYRNLIFRVVDYGIRKNRQDGIFKTSALFGKYKVTVNGVVKKLI